MLAGPAAEQVPGAQAQMFGDQQPKPHQVTGDLVGQKLSYTTFQAGGVTRFYALAFLGGLRLDGQLILGTKAVEFFFEARSLQSPAERYGC